MTGCACCAWSGETQRSDLSGIFWFRLDTIFPASSFFFLFSFLPWSESAPGDVTQLLPGRQLLFGEKTRFGRAVINWESAHVVPSLSVAAMMWVDAVQREWSRLNEAWLDNKKKGRKKIVFVIQKVTCIFELMPIHNICTLMNLCTVWFVSLLSCVVGRKKLSLKKKLAIQVFNWNS